MKLTSGGKFVKFKRGEVLLDGNTLTEGMMMEVKGLSMVYLVDKSGKKIPVAGLNNLWEVSIMRFFGEGSNLVVEAVTAGDMRVWSKEETKKFAEENRGLLAKSMTKLMELSCKLLTGNARQKVATIIQAAGDRGVDYGLAHKVIAGMTGLTRETVTLQMIKLEKEGVIDNKSRSVRILQPEKLEEIVIG